jgi:hypothetical protein
MTLPPEDPVLLLSYWRFSVMALFTKPEPFSVPVIVSSPTVAVRLTVSNPVAARLSDRLGSL